MKHLKNFKSYEAVQSNDQEYFDCVRQYYDDDLIEQIEQGDQMATQMTGAPIQTMKSDNGNLIVRWTVGGPYAIILGAVSKEGKLNRGDLADLNTWLKQCIQYLNNGKMLLSSPNELSEPLIKKVIKMAEAEGMRLDVQTQDVPGVEDNVTGRKWSNYMIRKI
jgi:hypothetical protein